MSNNKSTLKTYFEPGDRPTSLQFADLIDSSLNFIDDKASDAEAENSTIDNKFVTPKTARKSVEKYAPVKKVNNISPDINGNIGISVADIPHLVLDLNSKQEKLESGTNLKSINGGTLLTSGNLLVATPSDISTLQSYLPLSLTLTSGVASSSTTRSTINATRFSIRTGKKYKIEIIAAYQSGILTTGGSLGFITSGGGAGVLKGFIEMQTGTTTSEKTIITGVDSSGSLAGSFTTSSQVSSINRPQFIQASLYFQCTSDGLFILQWGSGVSGNTVELLKESVLIVTPLPN